MCNSIYKGIVYPIEPKGIGYKILGYEGRYSYYNGKRYKTDDEGWVNWDSNYGEKETFGFCFFTSLEEIKQWLKNSRSSVNGIFESCNRIIYEIEYEEGLIERVEPNMYDQPMIGLCHRFRILTSVDVALLE